MSRAKKVSRIDYNSPEEVKAKALLDAWDAVERVQPREYGQMMVAGIRVLQGQLEGAQFAEAYPELEEIVADLAGSSRTLYVLT